MAEGRGWVSRIEAFCFGPAPLHALVVLRAALGAILVACYAWRLPHWATLYGPEGFAGPRYTRGLELDGPLSRNLIEPLYALQHIDSPLAAALLYALLLACALGFALGWRTRVCGMAALGLHLLFYARNPWAYWGWGRMIVPFLLYAVLADSGRHLSLDALRARRRGAPPRGWLAPAWPLRLVQLHVCTQYLALWPRVESETWIHGRMLFAALAHRHYGRFEVDWLAHAELLAVLGGVAMVLEVGAPLALWIPRLGALWALGLMGMHLQIELAATVGWWNWMMIAALTAFLPTPWLRRALEVRPAAPCPTRLTG